MFEVLLFVLTAKAFALASEKIKFTTKTKASACRIWGVWFAEVPNAPYSSRWA
jgi:hypothetical protein